MLRFSLFSPIANVSFLVMVAFVFFGSPVFAGDETVIAIPPERESGLDLYKKLDADKNALDDYKKKQWFLLRINLFEEIGGDKNTNETTIEQAKKFLANRPNDLFVKSILASSTCRRALFVKSVGRKMLYVRKCTLALDKIVKKKPDDIGNLLIRVNTYGKLPVMFKKKKQVLADWRTLFELSKGRLDNVYAMSAFNIAKILERDHADESGKYYRIAAESKSDRWSALAKERL